MEHPHLNEKLSVIQVIFCFQTPPTHHTTPHTTTNTTTTTPRPHTPNPHPTHTTPGFRRRALSLKDFALKSYLLIIRLAKIPVILPAGSFGHYTLVRSTFECSISTRRLSNKQTDLSVPGYSHQCPKYGYITHQIILLTC